MPKDLPQRHKRCSPPTITFDNTSIPSPPDVEQWRLQYHSPSALHHPRHPIDHHLWPTGVEQVLVSDPPHADFSRTEMTTLRTKTMMATRIDERRQNDQTGRRIRKMSDQMDLGTPHLPPLPCVDNIPWFLLMLIDPQSHPHPL